MLRNIIDDSIIINCEYIIIIIIIYEVLLLAIGQPQWIRCPMMSPAWLVDRYYYERWAMSQIMISSHYETTMTHGIMTGKILLLLQLLWTVLLE